MATVSIIRRSNLQGRHRIDAEYYRPAFIRLDHILSGKKPLTISEISQTLRSFGAYSLMNQVFYQETGIPFLRGVDIKEGYADFSNVIYIDETSHRLLWKSEVIEGQVLLAMSGSVGNATVARPTWKYPVNSSQDLAKITLKPGYDPYYVATFLNSKYGRFQTERLPVGSIQQHVFLWQISSIKIPFFEKLYAKVSSIAINAIENLENSLTHYREAEQLLLSELGLKDWKPAHALTFVRSYSQAAKAGRMDGEYFQPKFDDILGRLSLHPVQRLSKVINQVTETVTFTESQKYRYIEISDVNTTNGEVGYTEREINELPPNAKIKVKGGELIVSKVRPTRGAIGIIPDDCRDNGVCSSAFVVLNVPSPTKEFLQVYLRSIVGKALLEQPCKGTSYPTIDDVDVLRLPIPIISTETQEKISDLVIQSHAARREAKSLLQKAKRAVEIAIEENEERAIEFIG